MNGLKFKISNKETLDKLKYRAIIEKSQTF